MKKDSSPISSDVMLERQADLLAGRVKPSTETDNIWLKEMNEILSAGGFISVPTDLPNPISRDEARWHLTLDDESEAKALPKQRVRFDWYGRDGDLDGQVQDGTPFERRSRSNSHNAIGHNRRLVQRLRLRDLPFPFTPPSVPADKPPVAATPEEKSLFGSARRLMGRTRLGGRGRRALRPGKFNPNAIDGNSDGTVQDGTRFERPATARTSSATGAADTPRVEAAKRPSQPKLPPRPHRSSKPNLNRWASDYADIVPEGHFERRYDEELLRDRAATREALQAEREARLRNANASSTTPLRMLAPSESKKKKKPVGNPNKNATPKVKPFNSLSARDDVGSFNDVSSQDLADLRAAVRSGDLERISELLREITPFGGHRSPTDGAHPAILDLMAKNTSMVEKKYGKLETVEEYEAALRQAFPNAVVGLREMAMTMDSAAVDVDNPSFPAGADENFRFRSPDIFGKLKKELGSDRKAKIALDAATKQTTYTLLALAEENPEIAKKLRYVGFTDGEELEGIAAFVTGVPLDGQSFGLFVNPVATGIEAVREYTPDEVAKLDQAYADWITSRDKYNPKLPPESTLTGLVADSNPEASVVATILHEWGHVTGMDRIESIVNNEIGQNIDFQELAFNDWNQMERLQLARDILASNISEDAKRMALATLEFGEDFLPAMQDTARELAGRLSDLAERMRALGMTVPSNLDQMPLQQRINLAMQLVQREVTSIIYNGIIGSLAFSRERTDASWRNRMLGQYANMSPEESAAELYLATRLGLDLTSFVDKAKDPTIYERLGK